MKAIAVYGVSAVEALDLGLCRRSACVERLDPAVLAGSADELRGFEKALPQLTRPVHILVADKASRRNSSRWHCHVSSRPLPMNSFIKVEDGIYVAAPHLCFAHFARRLVLSHAVLLGMELCGCYSTLSLHARAGRVVPERGYLERPPLAGSAVLARYAKACGFGPKSSASRACRLLRDGARSPAESQLSALLSMRSLQGGYARGGYSLNSRVPIPPALVPFAGVDNYECDFLWDAGKPHGKVDLEYDGEEFHSGDAKRSYDNVRRTVLGELGIRVVTLDKRQLYDQARFDSVVSIISEHLGNPLAPPSKTVAEQRAKLRKELLRPNIDLYPLR